MSINAFARVVAVLVIGSLFIPSPLFAQDTGTVAGDDADAGAQKHPPVLVARGEDVLVHAVPYPAGRFDAGLRDVPAGLLLLHANRPPAR